MTYMNRHGMAVIQTSWSVMPYGLNKFINFGNVFSDIIVFLFFLQLPLTWYLCLHNFILSSNLARSLNWTRTNSCFCWAHAIIYNRVRQDRSTTYELCLRYIYVSLQHSIKALFYFLGISTWLAAGSSLGPRKHFLHIYCWLKYLLVCIFCLE